MLKFRTIQTKFRCFSALALLLVFCAGATGWWSIGLLSTTTREVIEAGDVLKLVKSIETTHDAIRDDVLSAQPAFLRGDSVEVESMRKKLAEHLVLFQAGLAQMLALPLKVNVRAGIDATWPGLKGYEQAAITALATPASATEAFRQNLAAFDADFEQTETEMVALEALIEATVETSRVKNNEVVAWSRALIAGVGVLACALLLVVGSILARGIVRSIRQALEVAEAVANGDLTMEIEVRSVDETGELLRALIRMRDALLSTVTQVRSATHSINTASDEISSGNQALALRTEKASASLEETAASMEQLTVTVSQNADASRQANQLAASASEVAVRGGLVVGQVVTTMDEIHHSSQKISDIIGVIDGIAFQTNILALNAAVEAARAGEQGRGFAVVAAEVRNLAQRSAEAAKEIKGLIGTSVSKVEAGSRLVADAGQTMTEIVGSAQRVSDIIGEITASSEEQRDGIAQVNTAVNQLDQMTQQNAALVEESTAAAESLRNQAIQLMQVLQVFHGSDAPPTGASLAEPLSLGASGPASSPLSYRPSKVQVRAMSTLAPRPKLASKPQPEWPVESAAADRKQAADKAPFASSPTLAKTRDEDEWERF